MIDLKEIYSLVEQKYISVQKHPEADLYIYNYSQKTQFESVWNESTKLCRGLILDNNGNILARPFPKFFNLEELPPIEIPKEDFEVYEKMDGSLGIMYWHNNKPFIATRGSFTSDQAIWATDFLHSKFSGVFEKLDRSKTYLFEIIYPQNRIVVDYKGKEDLVLLGILDSETGKDEGLNENLGFTVVQRFNTFNDLLALKNKKTENFEGYVVKFSSGFRLKVKLDEYVRLHKIITNLSSLDVWKSLSENESLDSLLTHVPDEFFEWIKKKITVLETAYAEIENLCTAVFKKINDRKEASEYFKTQKYPMILFKMLDGKKYDYLIWRIIKPKHEKAFSISKLEE